MSNMTKTTAPANSWLFGVKSADQALALMALTGGLVLTLLLG